MGFLGSSPSISLMPASKKGTKNKNDGKLLGHTTIYIGGYGSAWDEDNKQWVDVFKIAIP